MTVTSYLNVLESLQISPKVAYEFLVTGIETERLKFQALNILKSPEAFESYHKILQGERLLCFIRRGIRAQESNHL